MSFDSDPQECFLDQLDTPYKEIDISVVDSVPRGSGLSSYIAYFVTMKSPKHFTIQRRYSEFSALREVLVKRWPGVMIPPLPAKHSSGSNSLKVVNQRIKYLTYFLNNCVKMNFIFMCDQFQLFLTSTSPNLKRELEKLLPLPGLLMLNRYEQAFPDIKADQNRRGQLTVLMRDQVEPFIKQLNSQRIYLINLKRQVFKLAKKRDQYLRTTRVLFCDTLPNLENHLTKTTQSVNLVLANNEQVTQSITVLKESNAKNYWLLFEALKLEIAESQAMIQALQSRNDLQRQQERLTHEIKVNQEQLKNIENKKLTLKQFFSRNNDDLIQELQQKNKIMRQEVESLKLLNLIVAEISTSQLISNFYLRRALLWRQSFSNYLCKQRQFTSFMESFFKIFLK